MTDTRTDAERCGVVRKCGRPLAHRGHCGGWRRLDAPDAGVPPTDRKTPTVEGES